MAKRSSDQFGSESDSTLLDEARNTIRLQTEAFLRQGGVIQNIPNGVSGQLWKPNKQTKTTR